jgi:hypothetical protein
MQVEDDEIDQDAMDLDERNATARTGLKLDQRVLHQIGKLFDAQHLLSILSLRAGIDAISLLTITNFIITLVVQWPTKKDQVLHSMLLRSPICSIWETFKTTDLFKKVKEGQSIPCSIITGMHLISSILYMYIYRVSIRNFGLHCTLILTALWLIRAVFRIDAASISNPENFRNSHDIYI